MKILLLGATGRVGNEIVKLLLEKNHEVIVLVRNQSKFSSDHPSLTIKIGNSLNKDDLEAAATSVDGVISALNTDGNQTLSKTMTLLLPILEKKNINRLVTIGTAGILQSRLEPSTLRYLSSESKRKSTTAAKDHEEAFSLIESTNLKWTIVCPTYLPEGPITKIYRSEKNFLPLDGTSISTGDTAYFTVNEFFEGKYTQSRVGISY